MTKEKSKGKKPHKMQKIAIREREEKNIMYEFRARKYLYY